jgi:drug/metabolite transporter (DMT)-like permease
VVDLLLYGESFSPPALLGMGLVVAGVYIISMR